MAGGPHAPHLIHIHGCALRVELAEVLAIIPNAASQLHHALPRQESALLFTPQSIPDVRSASFLKRVGELWPGVRLQGQHNACIRSSAAGCARSKRLHMAAKHRTHLEIG